MCDAVTDYVGGLVKDGSDSLKVMVCGHSLGGGLAHLSAYDLATRIPLPPDRISCHTIGCARIFGGSAAREVEGKVPGIFNVVNGTDAVYYGGKYMHVGARHPGEGRKRARVCVCV
jgi:hypothetical protein